MFRQAPSTATASPSLRPVRRRHLRGRSAEHAKRLKTGAFLSPAIDASTAFGKPGKGRILVPWRVQMRKWGLALAVAAIVPLGACVQTRQYADVQFTPPQGDYKLLVLRPDVTGGALTTGGMVEPRADWTEQARANIIAALRAQQTTRGGKLQIIERRTE